MGGQGVPQSSFVVVVVLASTLERVDGQHAQKSRTSTTTMTRTMEVILDTHYRSDGGGAGGALVFCSAGNKDCGIVGDRGDYGLQARPWHVARN